MSLSVIGPRKQSSQHVVARTVVFRGVNDDFRCCQSPFSVKMGNLDKESRQSFIIPSGYCAAIRLLRRGAPGGATRYPGGNLTIPPAARRIDYTASRPRPIPDVAR